MSVGRSVTLILPFLVLTNPGLAEPVLLGEFDAVAMGASAPATEFRIQIVLRNDLHPIISPVDIGFGTYWEDGETGIAQFGREDDNFDAMADRLTDGIDQFLSTIVFAKYGGAGDGAMESQQFGLPVDLIGNELDSIRLLVHSVSIQPWQDPHSELEGIRWDVDVTWEFWGQPVPEPYAVSLLLAGSVVVFGKSARRS